VIARRPLLVALLALAAACAPLRGARAPLKSSKGQPLRLGWITWSDVNELIYCNRRLDDEGQSVGVLGPCWRQVAGEPPKQIMSWLNAGRPDATPPTAGPWDRCAVEAKGDSQGAVATLLTPTGREPIEEWKPDAKVGGDVYAVELSFSPEGKWMAVAHLAIHLGEGERVVEIPSVDIRSVPACR
jgi:hypothetical protein